MRLEAKALVIAIQNAIKKPIQRQLVYKIKNLLHLSKSME